MSKNIELTDLKIIINQLENETLSYDIIFSDKCILKNPSILDICAKNLKPNDKMSIHPDSNTIRFFELPSGILYFHYLIQLLDLHDENRIKLDFSHVHPLTHEESIGDIRSTKLSSFNKKRVHYLESRLNDFTSNF